MFNWTDETFNQIIKLREQKLSYSKIAKRMGTTKNSVMVKMYRHKIKNGYKPNVDNNWSMRNYRIMVRFNL